MNARKRSHWNNEHRMLVVSGRRSTVRSLAATLAVTQKRLKLSLYRIAQGRSFTRDSVVRLLKGYGPLGRTRVMDPEEPGRVRLGTFLEILEAMGLDIEIVIRSQSKPPATGFAGKKTRAA